jgi:PPOX class probable F420-dependent enzyme
MTSKRDRVKLSPAEVRVFLAEQRTVVVSSRLPDDTTHLSALWYALDGEDLVFWTYASAQKTKNIERDPRVTALVEVGQSYDELRGVMIIGTAHISRDPAEVLRVGQLVAARYPQDLLPPKDISEIAGKRAAIRVVASRVITWDHTKLAGAY